MSNNTENPSDTEGVPKWQLNQLCYPIQELLATHGNSNLNGCTANKFKIQILSHTNDSSSVQWPSDWIEDIAIITEGSTGQQCS